MKDLIKIAEFLAYEVIGLEWLQRTEKNEAVPIKKPVPKILVKADFHQWDHTIPDRFIEDELVGKVVRHVIDNHKDHFNIKKYTYPDGTIYWEARFVLA